MSGTKDRAGVLKRQRVGAAPGPAKRGGSGGGAGPAADRLATIIAAAIVLAVVAGIGIVVVSLGGNAYRYVMDKNRLTVETIDVEGNVVLTPEEIVRLAGLRRNQPILALDLAALDRKIEEHPRIASAVVERHLPHRVLVKVTERVPVGLVQESGVLKGIDATGTVIPLIPSREEVKAPILTGFGRAAMPQDLRQEALEAIECLRPDLVTRISEVRLDPGSGLTLLTTGAPMVIRLGRGEMGVKVERLRAALKLFEDRGDTKEYIDVRFRDIVTRP